MAGHPATGKTTLARGLGRRLGFPVFTKDDVKEQLFDTLGVGDREWSKRLGRAAMAVLTRQLEATLAVGRSVIGEANFDARLATAEVGSVLERTGAIAVVIALHAEPAVIVSRFVNRTARHAGHLDAQLGDDIRHAVWPRYEPPSIGVVLNFEVSDASAFDRLLDEVAQALEVAAPQATQNRARDQAG